MVVMVVMPYVNTPACCIAEFFPKKFRFGEYREGAGAEAPPRSERRWEGPQGLLGRV